MGELSRERAPETKTFSHLVCKKKKKKDAWPA